MMSKRIMIQGTSSSVGKSLITAGLCRIFKQDGFKVAPFKSQNMALNSFITKEGKEMGRAQVVQAEAAGVEPSVEMNPILIKPNTDTNAQVIINGKVHGNMTAAQYDSSKPQWKEMIREVYQGLEAKYDIVVIEGAGSPAEINLRDNDVVNMGMAEIAHAPVILVGDIDKGGVFASLAGTMLLLTESEKARVKGVIINKFRGDMEILRPGLKMLEDIIRIPVIGVLPYFHHFIDDEDGHLDVRLDKKETLQNDHLDIAIIRQEHMSNYTDFSPLERMKGVHVRYVDRTEDLQQPDFIILPGTKNTLEDLLKMRESGLEKRIIELNRQGVKIFGICGGYQMLGLEIEDPYQTESGAGSIKGMGLLDITTVIRSEKIMTQAIGRIIDDYGVMEGTVNMDVEGYEIHMGVSEFGGEAIPFINISEVLGQKTERIDGVRNRTGTVMGTYIHGIFDNMEFTKCLVNNLRNEKGLHPKEQETKGSYEIKEEQYETLAKILRENLDLSMIYEIIGIEKCSGGNYSACETEGFNA